MCNGVAARRCEEARVFCERAGRRRHNNIRREGSSSAKWRKIITRARHGRRFARGASSTGSPPPLLLTRTGTVIISHIMRMYCDLIGREMRRWLNGSVGRLLGRGGKTRDDDDNDDAAQCCIYVLLLCKPPM